MRGTQSARAHPSGFASDGKIRAGQVHQRLVRLLLHGAWYHREWKGYTLIVDERAMAEIPKRDTGPLRFFIIAAFSKPLLWNSALLLVSEFLQIPMFMWLDNLALYNNGLSDRIKDHCLADEC